MTVKSAARVVDILELLADHPGGLTMTEIGLRLGYPLSATHALVMTLLERDLLMQEKSSKRYRLGSWLFALGNQYLNNFSIVDIAKGPMRKMQELCDETISLGIIDGDKIVLVHRNESSKALRTVNPIGTRLPLHSSAMGKAILATWPEKEVVDFLKHHKLEALTPHSITDGQQLLKELREIKRTKIAYDLEESTEGVHALATAICGGNEKAKTSIAIVVPSVRAKGERWESLRNLLIAGKEAICRLAFGYETSEELSSDGINLTESLLSR
jgi:IclR family transcriptional regulator, KDG regulon repressor